MLTFNDVNRDIKAIIDGVSDSNRVIPSTLAALRTSFLIPLVGISLSTVTFLVVCAQINNQDISLTLLKEYVLSGDALPIYMSWVIGLAQSLMLLPYINIYNVIPSELRKKTVLINAIKKGMVKGGLLYLSLLLISCLLSFENELFLFSTPIIMFLSIFITSLIVNVQVAKYSVGPLLGKLKSILQ